MKVRSPLVFLFAVACMTCSQLASAQTGTIDPKLLRHSRSPREIMTANSLIWMNKADCLANDVLTVTISSFNLGAGSLQLWASTEGKDCQADTVARTSQYCWRLTDNIITPTVPLSVRRLIPVVDHSAHPPGGADPAESICDAMLQGSNAVALNLYPFDSNNQMQKALSTVGLVVDLVGPAAPALRELQAGDASLILDWGVSNSTGIGGYEMFCEKADPDAEGCTSPMLKQGEDPPLELQRGSRTSGTASQGTATGLENNVKFACAIAASDTVFNRGKLSNVVCGVPLETINYFEAYQAAGGDAGGGYCTFGKSGARSATATGVVLAALGLLFRRSRRGAA